MDNATIRMEDSTIRRRFFTEFDLSAPVGLFAMAITLGRTEITRLHATKIYDEFL